MRDPIENISQLQKQLNDLQLENQILKNILDQAGLSYYKELSAFKQNENEEAYDPEQGKRIIHPSIITENMANQFFGMFWGRQDVYAKRSVNKESGKASMQNRIRRMAAISNPIFYKNQAIGTSNYDTPRWIYRGKDHLSGYIQIPKGLQDELLEKVKKASIDYEIEDEREQGRKIRVEFEGELRPEQDKALKELTKYDNGILHAATAFGKMVVSSAIIAQKKVNTLIILIARFIIRIYSMPTRI